MSAEGHIVGEYKEILLEHYRNPRNRDSLIGAAIISRGSNPRCGDQIEVGLNLVDDIVDRVRFRGCGCSICIASASLMTEAVSGRPLTQVKEIYREMKAWVSDEGGLTIEALQPLSIVRSHPSRLRCVMLAWDALNDGLKLRPRKD